MRCSLHMGAEQSSTAAVEGDHSAAAAQLQAAADGRPIKCDALAGGAAPTPRETAGAFYSKDGTSALVLFGGHGTDADDDQEHNDVWVLPSGGQWQPCSAGGRTPRARSGHTVTAVPKVGLVVFGGLSHEKGYLQDVALLAPNAEGALEWQPLCVTGELPAARDKHSAVVAPAGADAGARILCYGGFGVMPPRDEDDEDGEGEGEGADEGDGEGEGEERGPSVEMGWFGDVYELDVRTWRWRKLLSGTKSSSSSSSSAPPARAAHACCLFGGTADPEHMLVFGGRTMAGRTNDTWLLDVTAQTWTAPALAGSPPSPRSFHSAVALGGSGGASVAAVFGGLDAQCTHLADLHLLDMRARAWVRLSLSDAPSPRGCATLCAIPSAAVGGASDVLVFGGSAKWDAESARSTSYLNDTHRIPLAELVDELAAAATAAAAAAAAAAASTAETTTTVTTTTPAGKSAAPPPDKENDTVVQPEKKRRKQSAPKRAEPGPVGEPAVAAP